MVRFSDMLGGSGEPDDAAAAESPYAALANDAGDPDADELEAESEDESDSVKEPVPMATFESPEAVLDRLTQYATSARVIETAEPEIVEPEPVAPEPSSRNPLRPKSWSRNPSSPKPRRSSRNPFPTSRSGPSATTSCQPRRASPAAPAAVANATRSSRTP